MKIFVGIILVLCITQPAFAASPADLKDFEKWAADNLLCERNFLDDVQNVDFLNRVRQLGVTVKSEWQSGNMPEGTFQLDQPTVVAGLPIREFTYWGDSGAEFYSEVEAPTSKVAELLHLAPVTAKERKDVEPNVVAVRHVGKQTSAGRRRPAIFVRTTDKPNVSEVGCHYSDG
jgi:hypothetical protein